MAPAKGSQAANGDGSALAAPQAIRLRAGDDFDRNVWCVLGLPIDAADSAAAVSAVEAAVRDGRRLIVGTPNVNWLVRALRDAEARREILEVDLSLADGAPIALIARLLGAPLAERTAGSDVFEALRARSGVRGRRIRVFFFGGREGSAEAAAAALGRVRGGLEAVGFYNPGHGDVGSMSTDAIIDTINLARPDLIVVAIGAAKGQAWIDRNKHRLNAPVLSPLGAVVDFTAGSIPRAPSWMQRSGLEWLWRIRAEPSLWKRYASDGVGLGGAVATRLLPQLPIGRSRAPGSPARAAITGEQPTVIRLSGQLTGDLSVVRQCFREAAAASGDIILDVSSAEYMDHAFLGLVLMLEKHAGRRAARIVLRGASRRQRTLFKANAMNYPTATAKEDLGAEAPIARTAAS